MGALIGQKQRSVRIATVHVSEAKVYKHKEFTAISRNAFSVSRNAKMVRIELANMQRLRRGRSRAVHSSEQYFAPAVPVIVRRGHKNYANH